MNSTLSFFVFSALVALVLSQELNNDESSADKRARFAFAKRARFAFAKRFDPYPFGRQFAFAKRSADDPEAALGAEELDLEPAEKRARFAFAKRARFAFAKRARFAFA